MSASTVTYYLTKEGYERFREELEQLRKLREAKMRDEKPEMMHSEEINPEYLSFQEDLDLLENRIVELDTVVRNAQLLEKPPNGEQHIVRPGATVKVKANGRTDEFTIVGSMEANPSTGRISYESPVGKALLNREKNEQVTLSSPVTVTYTILDIHYAL